MSGARRDELDYCDYCVKGAFAAKLLKLDGCKLPELIALDA
jgi:hypothetical protein